MKYLLLLIFLAGCGRDLKTVDSHQRIDIDIRGHQGFIFRGNSRAWVWYAPTLFSIHYPGKTQEWLFAHLLNDGISVAGIDVGESYGSPQGRMLYQEFYEALIRRYGLSSKPCLLAQSRGALMLYNWAEHHPNEISCIGNIYPVINRDSWEPAREAMQPNPIDDLAPIIEARIPIFILHGDSDRIAPLEENSELLIRQYPSAKLEIVSGKGHEEVDEFFHSKDLVQFIESRAN